jgi:Ni/Co efflux regulator RcnB
MKTTKFLLSAALVAASAAAMADTATTNTSRDDRMNEALQNYRSGDTTANSSASTSRGDKNAFERGVDKTGNAIKRGAHKTGNAIKSGAHKTGDAIERTGEKIKEKTTN